MSMRPVEFVAEDGTILRGDLYLPATARPAAGIVMAHGFSGVKERIAHYAAAFAEAGYAVLVHDHRSFGASDGTPRYEVDPAAQAADWRDAITYLLEQPEVDADRGVGIWGSSFAGGLAFVLASTDTRVRVVVAQVPNVSGARNAREMFTVDQRRRLDEQFRADRASRRRGGEPATIPVYSTDPNELCALPPAVTAQYIQTVEEQAPSWSNTVTLRSVEHMVTFEPAGWLPYVSPTPLLMIVATHDTVIFPEIQLDAYAQAKEPKRLVLHDGGHFDTYDEHFEVSSRAAVEWFVEHHPPTAAADQTGAER